MTQSTDCERGEYGQNGLYGLYGLRALGCEGAKRPGKFKSARHTGCHALCPTCPTARLTVSALRNVPCQPTEYTAMRYKNSKAHGTHCTMCPSSVHIRTHPYLSVRHCSQYRLCAMHTANRRECALFSGERIFPPLAADGIPNGIRTRVAGMRTRCPRPLDDGNTSMIRCLYYTPHPGKSKFTFLLFRSFYT